MSATSKLFEEIFGELKVPDGEQDSIRERRCEIVKVLNREFRGTDSPRDNSHFIGSYGRSTAIRGVSDLDMVYKLPVSIRDHYSGKGGSYKALSDTKDAIRKRYPNTEIRVDQTVVVVQFQNFKFEVQPTFPSEGQLLRPDSHDNKWKLVNPIAEKEAFRDISRETNGKSRKLARLMRAWKQKSGVKMNGLLIDTFVYRFFRDADEDYSFGRDPGRLVLDFFEYLAEQPKNDHVRALGSNQLVDSSGNFQAKARAATAAAQDAIDAEGLVSERAKWKEVFGKFVPGVKTDASYSSSSSISFRDTEEFIEEFYPVSIVYDLKIDCEVTQNGFRPRLLRRLIRDGMWLLPKKKLDFRIASTNVPEPFEVKWKVLNCGEEAKRRDEIRGQILSDGGQRTRQENTKFRGRHLVECYLVKNGVVVARGRIDVPIKAE